MEAQLPWLDHTILQRVQDGDVAGALRLIEDAPPLSIFSARDHGGLLAIAGLHRRAVQYEIGNPLTATKMTRQRISAALYAPVRVLLREDSWGEVAFEYDRPRIHIRSVLGTGRSTLLRRSLTGLCKPP